jgi:hypothetical protein
MCIALGQKESLCYYVTSIRHIVLLIIFIHHVGMVATNRCSALHFFFFLLMMHLGVSVEVAGEEGLDKRPRGRPLTVGHFHEDVSPTHLCKVLMPPGIEVLPLPESFRPYLGPVPGQMIMKTTTGC